MFIEGTLVEKLRKLEALHAGTKVDGEREAARRAAERIRARLEERRGKEKEVELLSACRIRGRESSSSPAVDATASSRFASRAGRCRIGHFWALVAPGRHVLFDFTRDHTSDAVDDVLAGYQDISSPMRTLFTTISTRAEISAR